MKIEVKKGSIENVVFSASMILNRLEKSPGHHVRVYDVREADIPRLRSNLIGTAKPRGFKVRTRVVKENGTCDLLIEVV